MKLPKTARSIVWLVALVKVKCSKPVTTPAKLGPPDSVAARAAVMVNVSVPMPPVMAAVGVAEMDVMVSESSPPPREITLVDVVTLLVTLSTPLPPVYVAMDASTVTLDVPVEAVVFTAVTVEPVREAVMPAVPDTLTVFNAVAPVVEVRVRTLVPATFKVVIPPKVMFDKVESTPVVVTFRVV